ncbi:hypothetical protein RJ639_002101 [Escallonia herrerae]|uniref:Uncharacterized protein n=1 Tax=Escallonia herrerae TaxID=1293975 RepID=A0AA88XBA5_9ASTE|nr:hypothetical protein RJ639_002101 [Escallonia herrerae]
MNFSTIDLSRNKLVGDISFIFGKNKSTKSTDYSRNMFEFDFSKVKEFPASLVSLDLNHNEHSGELDKEGMKKEKCDGCGLRGTEEEISRPLGEVLNMSYNRLYGKIPTGGNLQSFDVYSYLHNKCLHGAPLRRGLYVIPTSGWGE